MTTVACLIATYGSDEWDRRGDQRALPSAAGFDEVIRFHDRDGTLASVRNAAAAMARSEHLVFLDGDDELAPGYAEGLRERIDSALAISDRPIIAPMVSYVVGTRRQPPKAWPRCDLYDGNWVVIGASVPRWLFEIVGGFRDWPIYEDWCLWQRCDQHGAVFVQSDLVYVAHVRRSSRNRSPSHAEKLRLHNEIRDTNYPHGRP